MGGRERGENGGKLGNGDELAERRVQVEGTIGNGDPFLPFSPSRFLSRLTLTGSPENRGMSSWREWSSVSR